VRFKEPKTEKSRRDVALTAGAIEVLRLQHVQQSELRFTSNGPLGDERLVFPNPRDGQPWKPDTFSNEFLRAVKASGLPKGDIPWFASLVRVDLTAGRHAPEGRFRDARSHDDGDHRRSLHARAWKSKSRSC